MASQFGAAQPIADWVREFVYTPAKNFLDTVNTPSPRSKTDTSWHDSMVKAANRSFLPIQKRKLGNRRKPLDNGKRKRSAKKR